MSQSYTNLPLQVCLNKHAFNSATEICISTFALDITFVKHYLTELRKDVIIFVDYAKIDEDALEYLNKGEIGKLKLFKIPASAMRCRKEILIRSPESFLTLLTSSNLTQAGLEDKYGQHVLATTRQNYVVKKIQFILRRHKEGWDPTNS